MRISTWCSRFAVFACDLFEQFTTGPLNLKACADDARPILIHGEKDSYLPGRAEPFRLRCLAGQPKALWMHRARGITRRPCCTAAVRSDDEFFVALSRHADGRPAPVHGVRPPGLGRRLNVPAAQTETATSAHPQPRHSLPGTRRPLRRTARMPVRRALANRRPPGAAARTRMIGGSD